MRFLFSMERNRRLFKRLFPPDLFEKFIDVGHYQRDLGTYQRMIETLTALPVSSHFVSWEPEGRYCSSKMFRWEPEGHYYHCGSALLVPKGTSLNCNNALLALNGTSLNCNNALLVLNGTSLNCNNALLALNGTSLNCNNALLALNWRFVLSLSRLCCSILAKGTSDKSDISCKQRGSNMCLSFLLISMKYHDVFPNISLSRMSVYAHNLARKKSTLGTIWKHQ